MKKFFIAFFVFALLVALPTDKVSASNYSPVVFLSSFNKEAVVGNISYIDLIVNSLGTQVETFDVYFTLEGPFNYNSVSYNWYPDVENMYHVSSGLELVSMNYESVDNKLNVHVVFKAKDETGFNEGSSAVPIYRMGIQPQAAGEIRAYITANTEVTQVDGALAYDNYSPESKPALINVFDPHQLTPSTNTTVITTPSPDPSTTPAPITPSTSTPSPKPTTSPNPTPSPVVETDYDQEFEQLREEISGLRKQVDDQKEEIGFLRRLLNQILRWFGRKV